MKEYPMSFSLRALIELEMRFASSFIFRIFRIFDNHMHMQMGHVGTFAIYIMLKILSII